MSLSLEKTKHRIASIQSIGKTTKAMGLLAAAKLNRYRLTFEKEKTYMNEMQELAALLLSYAKKSQHFLKKGEGETLYIVIGSDLGLCGAYNEVIFKEALKQLEEEKGLFLPLGKKAENYFKSRYPELLINEAPTVKIESRAYELRELANYLLDGFLSKKFKSIKIIHAHYINAMKYLPVTFELLPLSHRRQKWAHEEYCPPLFDGDVDTLFAELLPSYLSSILHDLFLESLVTENSARHLAMENANENVDNLLEALKIEYNKARQNAITQEISEVTGGSVN